MKSVYSIRIFEMIQSKIYSKTIPKKGTEVYLSVEEIRTACDIVDKYKNYTSFKDKIIINSLREIHEKTYYDITYTEKRKGRGIEGYVFKVTMNYMKNLT